jgi:hypothetical protein
MSGEAIRLSIRLRLAVDSLHAVCIKEKGMLVFNFIFDLSWRGWCSSVSYVAFFKDSLSYNTLRRMGLDLSMNALVLSLHTAKRAYKYTPLQHSNLCSAIFSFSSYTARLISASRIRQKVARISL